MTEKKLSKNKKIIIAIIAILLALVIAAVSIFVIPGFFEEKPAGENGKKPSSSQTDNSFDDKSDEDGESNPFDDQFTDVFDEDDDSNPFDDYYEDTFFDEDDWGGIEDWEDTNNYDNEIELPTLGSTYYFENFDEKEGIKVGEELSEWRISAGGDDMYFYLDDSESRSGKYSGRVAYKSKSVGWGAMYTPLLNENWTSKDRFGFWLKGNGQANRAGVTLQIKTKDNAKSLVVVADADEWQYFSYDLRKDFGFTDKNLECVTQILITLGGGFSLPIYIDDMGVYNSKDGSPAATPVTKLDFENTGAEVGGALELGTVLESGNPMNVTLDKENSGNHFGKIEYSTTDEIPWAGTVISVDKQNWQILSQMQMKVKTDGSRQLVKMGFYGKENLWEYSFYADSTSWVDVSAVWAEFVGSGAMNLADVKAISLMFAAKEAGDYTIYIDDVTATYVEAKETDTIDNFENYPNYEGEKDNFKVDFGTGDSSTGGDVVAENKTIVDFEDISNITLSENCTIKQNSFNGTTAMELTTTKNPNATSWGVGTAEISFNEPITVSGNTFAVDVTNAFRTDVFYFNVYKGDELVGSAASKLPNIETLDMYTNRSTVHTLIFRCDEKSTKELTQSNYSGITKITINANPYGNKSPLFDNLRQVNSAEGTEGVLVEFDTLKDVHSMVNINRLPAENSPNGTESIRLYGGKQWQTDGKSTVVYFDKDITIAGNLITFDLVEHRDQQYVQFQLIDKSGNVLASKTKHTTETSARNQYTGTEPYTNITEFRQYTWEFTDLTEDELSKVRGIIISTTTWSSGINPIIDNIKFSSKEVDDEENDEKLFDMSNWIKSGDYSGGISADITEDSAYSGDYGVKIKLEKGAGSYAAYNIVLPTPLDITEYNQISMWLKGDTAFARQVFRLEIVSEYGTVATANYDMKSNGEWKNIVFDYSDLTLTGRLAGRIIGYNLIFMQYDVERTICLDEITLKTAKKYEIVDTETIDDFETKGTIDSFSVHEKYADGIKIERTNAEKYNGSYSAKVTVPSRTSLNNYYTSAAITKNFDPHIDGMYSGNCLSFKFKGDGLTDTMRIKMIVECGKTFAESAWITVDSSGEWIDVTRSYVQLGLTESQSQEVHGLTILAEMEENERYFYVDDIMFDVTARVGAFITDTLDEFEIATPEYVFGTEIVGTGGSYDTSVSASWMGSKNAAIIQGSSKETDNWYGMKRVFAYPFDIWGDGNYNNLSVRICTHAADDNLKVRMTLYTDDAESYTVICDVGETTQAGCYTLLMQLDDFGFTDKQFKEITGYKFEMLFDETFQAVYFDQIKVVK